MKKLFVSLVVSFCAPVFAVLTPYDIASAVSCNQDMNSVFYNVEFTKQFGPSYKKEGDATWYHATGELYGAQIKDVFVSASKEYSFVGVVLGSPPETVIENIKTSRIIPTNVFPSSNGWVGADGRSIAWHEKKDTKVFCIGGNGRHINV